MTGIKQFFINTGAYAGPLMIFLAEMLAFIVLMNGFFRLQRKKKKEEENRKGARLFWENYSGNQKDVQMLLRREDARPVFITSNVKELLGLERDRILADVELLETVISRRIAPELHKAYESWDGVSAFSREIKKEKDGGWLRLTITRTRDEKYDLFIYQDITEEKEKLLDLEKDLEKAEEVNEYKTKFLSRMSHEIRTPMNGIMGMIALAQTRLEKDHPAGQYLEKAGELSGYLLSLINDILDMSRIEAGKLELEQKPFDLYALADKLRNMFQKNLEAKGVHFEVNLLDFDYRCVVGDELRISQVLVNFLSNSQKFTSQGEIIVTFRQMMAEEGMMSLMFRVHDTGIGMKPEFISHIFRPFEQESTDITKNYGGSGLGMAIADQIVRAMGGEILIDSMVGKGSDFTIYLTLPIAENQEIAVKAPDTAEVLPEESDESDFRYDGMRILMAEDNEINAEIASEILEMQGAELEVAVNGADAVEKFTSHPAGYYSFILMDIQMPVMDGREAARRIRDARHEDSSKILIFALSADAFVEDKRRSVEAGMDGHFSKPIDFEAMRKGIGKIMRERGYR